MNSRDIRKKFFDFFVRHGHQQVPSSSLIPAQDPTLLFTNAGMNQFKDLFLGLEKRSYTKAVTIQKCVRAGGKHNDLDNVGFTKRHLTFFEMMGNFSFGDYFKDKAIRYAWDFLTKELDINKENLWVSVYKDDNEAYEIWHSQIGVSHDRIVKLGEKDNFWQMGDVGPCGPCTEIYVDRGSAFGCGSQACAPGCDCDRFLEVWNNVFMQFDRQEDGSLVPLKQTGVDTGMGLERIASIIEEKDSVFETDLFMPIIHKIEQLTGLIYKNEDALKRASFNVLADHIRSSTFLIADGCTPSNEGRGYVLRKIIRRAALFERKIAQRSIFAELVDVVVSEMGEFYPELVTNKDFIKRLLASEIDKFAMNLIRGTTMLENFIKQSSTKTIPGVEAFKLYDTYGFPFEVTKLIAHEHGFAVDKDGFEAEMARQRALSGKKMVKAHKEIELPETISSTFVGYEKTETESNIVALLDEGDSLVQEVQQGEIAWVIAQDVPFFAACGGQVDDEGFVVIHGHRVGIQGLRKIGSVTAFSIKAPAVLKVGQSITMIVDQQKRLDTMNNHTATHLLQAALIQLLGKTVRQSGSVVTPDYLRFDFTYHENLTPDQIKIVEDTVNQKIRENIPTTIFETTYKNALDKGVMAIFGEKYNPESVRVVQVPGFSAELCGGTHVSRTGDIGCFKITEVSALSAGNRRIVALTGPRAMDLYQQSFATVKALSQDFKVKTDEVLHAVEKQKNLIKELTTQIAHMRRSLVQQKMSEWLQQIRMHGDMRYLIIEVADFDNADLKKIAEDIIAQEETLVFVINKVQDRCTFICMIPAVYSSKVDLKTLAKKLNELGLKGGASVTSIQGGGSFVHPARIEAAIKSI